MTATLPERRRVTLLGDLGPVDLAVPVDELVVDAVRRGGVSLDPARDLIVDRGGYTIDLDSDGAALDDGGVYAVVRAPSGPVGARRARAAAAAAQRSAHGAGWWALAAVPVPAVALVVLSAPDAGLRIATAAVLGIVALLAAVVWSTGAARVGAAPPAAMIGALGLAAAAGALSIPPDIEAAGHLQTVAGLLAASVLALVLAVCDAVPAQRAAWSATAVLLLGLVVIWGVALLVHLSPAGAAAISVGAVPLVLRALPSTLVNVSDGYFIDYRHFMSNRWSVRGTVPASPASIKTADAERVVQASNARLVAGTVLLAGVVIVGTPFAATAVDSADPFVEAGGIALLVCTTIALLLTPRRTSGRLLRWTPRFAAAVVLVVGAVGLAGRLGPVGGILVGASVFVVAFVAAVAIVPIGRGASSLAWSRLADVLEWIAVALALPAGLLAANVLDVVRGMMSG